MREWLTTKDKNILPFSITESVTVERGLERVTQNTGRVENAGCLINSLATVLGKTGPILFIV